jgi:hypothetical protein
MVVSIATNTRVLTAATATKALANGMAWFARENACEGNVLSVFFFSLNGRD